VHQPLPKLPADPNLVNRFLLPPSRDDAVPVSIRSRIKIARDEDLAVVPREEVAELPVLVGVEPVGQSAEVRGGQQDLHLVASDPPNALEPSTLSQADGMLPR